MGSTWPAIDENSQHEEGRRRMPPVLTWLITPPLTRERYAHDQAVTHVRDPLGDNGFVS